jgi:hypothetical protein
MPAVSRRVRAVMIDVATIAVSLPLVYLIASRSGRTVTADAFWADVSWTVPLSIVPVVVRRLMHARPRSDRYDFTVMNPSRRLDTADVVSGVPYIGWDRHRGEPAFFDAVGDRERELDVPGFAIDVLRRGRPAQALDVLDALRPFARLWEREGDTLHAVFDIPPSTSNRWLSDHGARLWASAVDNGDGMSRIRVVLGSGGFGQGQAAAPVMMPALALLPASAGGLLALCAYVEAEYRGAVGWWIHAGQLLGVDDSVFEVVEGWDLQAAVAAGVVETVRQVSLRRVAGAVVAAVVVAVALAALAAAVASSMV